MSDSSLISGRVISPNRNHPRNHKIDTITIHCAVGQIKGKQLATMFQAKSKQASCNYCIGTEGDIWLVVPEEDRSWCSSNRANDQRAITIECASDLKEPYAINAKVWASLIKLLVDICKRNNIPELRWKADKALIGAVDRQNMTVHRWFANKSCPGNYLYERMGEIANLVNEELGGKKSSEPFMVKVSTNNVWIRKGPGNIYDQCAAPNDVIRSKGVYTVTEVQEGPGSKAGWGKLKSGLGWINLDLVQRVKG